MMLALSEQEKMRAAAEMHLSTGSALLAAAGASSVYQKFGRGNMYPKMNNNLKNAMGLGMARSNSLLDGYGSFIDPSLFSGMPTGMPNQPTALSEIRSGMNEMGGFRMNDILRSRDILSNTSILPDADRNNWKLERLMMMRRREAMVIAEERAKLEAMEVGMKMKSQISSVVTPGSELDSESTLAALGNSMRKKSSPYIDASKMADPPEYELARRRTRGGVTEPFPEKLHRMLLEIEKDGDSKIVSFFPHGRAFGIHDTDKFEEKIMPKYFKQSRLSSFQRQLNLYGFTRIVSGPDSGGYYHELFLKGRPNLCTHMRRVGIPKGVDRRKIKSANAHKKEPDFYSMRPTV